MTLPRPYIPIPVRVIVAERQLVKRGIWTEAHRAEMATVPMTASRRLECALALLLAGDKHHLDHNPPLGERQFNPETKKYTPDANDPDHLFYLTVPEHRVKTYVRGEHGQFSDTALMKRERRRKRAPKPKRKWPSRPFANRTMRGK